MIAAFTALTRREQLLIGLAALVLPAALIWQFAWKPLEAERTATLTEIARLDALIHVAAQAGSAERPAMAAVDPRPASQRISQSAAAAGIALTRLEPEGRQFRVAVSELQFDAALQWIAALRADHGLKVAELDMARRLTPGAVTLTLALEPLP
ncbi:type II secretion system protein GspM [Marinovum sp.]|uniref:type II secretion system protein GspM n=1 Tax=Marinovum sp. TaxID=2024839 RepID=UPI002B2713F2|nr:type II secretion system protein GspM [Marinovum sp.]